MARAAGAPGAGASKRTRSSMTRCEDGAASTTNTLVLVGSPGSSNTLASQPKKSRLAEDEAYLRRMAFAKTIVANADDRERRASLADSKRLTANGQDGRGNGSGQGDNGGRG